jgi:hypothetical protein
MKLQSRMLALLYSLLLIPGLASSAATGELSAMLKSTIEAVQQGKPNLSDMEPLTAAAVEQQSPAMRPVLKQMGKIQSLAFLGIQNMPMGSGEAYRVKFENGSMLWVISESSAGKIQILWTSGPEQMPGR